MNIFFRELKTNFKSLLIWGGIVMFFCFAGFEKFSAYYNNPELLVIINSMPKALLSAFDMNAFNLTTITGFFGVMFNFFALILSIAAAMWGSDIISKEERDKTVEFSLSLPVTRSKIITAKTLAAFVNCIGLLLITWGITLAATSKYQPDSEFYNFLSLGMLALFIMQTIFLSIGIFLGSAMKQYKRAGSLAVSILLGTYFFSVISGMSDKLEFLKYFSPFKYFDSARLLHESRLDMTFVWLSVAIIVVSLIGAYSTYSKRDLYI